MVYYQKFLLISALMTGLFCSSSVIAEITVEPFGFAVSVEEDGEVEVELVFSNNGEDDVAFNIDYELIVDEDDWQAGPRRDDLGDVLREFDLPFSRTDGMVWDGDNLWACSYGDSRYCCFNEDFEVISNFQTAGQVVGMTFDAVDGVFWMGQWNTRNVFLYDREGNRVGTIEMPVNCNGGYATDGEFFYWISEARNFQLHKMDRDLNVVAQVPNLLEHIGHSIRVMAIEYVREHRDGRFWVTTRQPGYCVQLDVDWDAEEANVVQEFEIRNLWAHEGLTHDGHNLYQGGYGGERTGFIFDDGIREFDMLTVEPEDGVIPGDDSETVSISVVAEGYEAGVYNVLIEIELVEPEQERDDFEESIIQITALVSLNTSAFNISGTVTNAGENDAIAGARIEPDRYFIAVFSDNEGVYGFENLPPGDYELYFSAADFLPTTEEVTIEEDDVELNVALLHSVCLPSEESFFWILEPGMEHTFNFNVHNGGNGTLTYTVDRRLLGEANAEPWELRSMYNTEQVVNDDMINGVTFAEDHFYVSGGNNGGNPNMIYVFDNEGEQTGEFEQVHESRYGMRDLTYDGDLIWGADDNVLYGYYLDGELAATLEGEAQSYRSLTWDPINQWFWSADITSNIFATNREGNLVQTVNRPGDIRIYGLGFWPDDPDGHCLYVFSRGDEIDITVYKINLDNGEAMLAAEFDAGGSRPGGIHITNQLDVYSWVMMGIVQTPDRMMVWQLSTNLAWFQIEPEVGEIEANQNMDFILTLNSADLPPDNRFEGELVFRHDGVGGETILPVRLDVQEVWFPSCDLDLHIGWNTVSVNLQPDDYEDICWLMAPLVEEDLLIMMKNGAGEFYIPEYDYNNIPGWFVNEGYQLKMRGEAVFRLYGLSVLPDEPIELHEGWQLISYYPRVPIETTIALSGIENNLIIAKDGRGNFYIPDWNFSNMGDMREGQGYYVNVDADVNLVYRRQLPDEEGAFAGVRHSSVYAEPGQLPVHAVTGSNMSLLVLANPPLQSRGGTKGGVNIGIYVDDALVGSGVLQNGVCGIAVWGDDPSTNETDGALEGQPLDIRLLADSGLITPEYTVLAGETVYSTDGFAVVQLTASSIVPVEFGISSAYPNPFNSVLRISYGLIEAGDVSLNVYDLTGRHVAELVNGNFKAGTYAAVLDGADLSSGVYMLRLESGGDVSQMKVALVK